jgi:phytoene desaturase
MSTGRKVVVVGGGPGGLAAAMLLAHRGFEVTVLEKEPEVGGRTSALLLGDYTFDRGSTLLMMRFLVEEIFALTGRRLTDELELVPLDPMYRLVFGDRSLDIYADPIRMEAELARFAPGSEVGLTRFLEREHDRLEHLYPVLQKSWPNLASMLDSSVLVAAPHVGMGRSLHDTAADYFSDERVQLGFSFQSAYLGMSPWKCPGGFGMVPYVEHAWGVDYVKGGIHRLCAAMLRVASELGARIRTRAEVARILVENDRSVGVQLVSGERVPADDVVIDADAPAALSRLLDRDVSLRFSRSRLEHLNESCSTFMLYLGLDTRLPLVHHTFFFADDYQAEMERVFRDGTLGDDISVYACNPVVTDPGVAPEGHSSLYLLALVPNAGADIDWDREDAVMRARVLAAMRDWTGVDLEPHIRAESRVTPAEWQRRYNILHGAVFGPAHNITQLLAFRLPNRLPSPDNVFLTGGGTSPGSGLPTILESARIATRLVCERHGMEFPPSRPLPAPTTWHPRRSRPAVEAAVP